MSLNVRFGSPLPAVSLDGLTVSIRPFDHDDLHIVEEASNDEFIPQITSVPATFTREDGLAFIDRQNGRLSDGEGWSLAIVDRETGTALGQVGLWIGHLAKGRAEIGYWVAPSGRGRGAAAAAVRLLADWAFEHLDVDRLSLFIEPWNQASRTTADRAGFTQEGVLRGWERVDGVPKDMYSYARLRSD